MVLRKIICKKLYDKLCESESENGNSLYLALERTQKSWKWLQNVYQRIIKLKHMCYLNLYEQK